MSKDRKYDVLLAMIAIVIVGVGMFLLTGCTEGQQVEQAPVWGEGELPAEYQAIFGNDNVARLVYMQNQVQNRHAAVIRELAIRVLTMEGVDPNDVAPHTHKGDGIYPGLLDARVEVLEDKVSFLHQEAALIELEVPDNETIEDAFSYSTTDFTELDFITTDYAATYSITTLAGCEIEIAPGGIVTITCGWGCNVDHVPVWRAE